MTADVSAMKGLIHRRFLEDADAEAIGHLSPDELNMRVRDVTVRVLRDEGQAVTGRTQNALINAVLSEITGLGPIEPLLQDPEITEIMINGYAQVYVEREGKLYRSDARFDDDAHLMRIITRIVSPLGRRIDEASPLVDARLLDGSRINAVIPPLAVRGPALTIRKFARVPYVLDDLVHLRAMTSEMALFLQACVRGRLNILVSGGAGSGKTTLLNALSAFIPEQERIITIEDAAELQLQQAHVLSVERRPANLEGRGAITIRDLVRNALRMRPDRILIGEVRGGETLDMLTALNTGHDGSLSTAHANSPRDLLARLETMVLMAGMELPARAVREQIGSALHLVIHQSRQRDGTRKITHITEILGAFDGEIQTQDLFRFTPEGTGDDGQVLGTGRPTGLLPSCLDFLERQGVSVSPTLFLPGD